MRQKCVFRHDVPDVPVHLALYVKTRARDSWNLCLNTAPVSGTRKAHPARCICEIHYMDMPNAGKKHTLLFRAFQIKWRT